MTAKAIQVLTGQAEELLAANRIDEAQAVFERITTLDPTQADAWFRLGTILGAAGKLERGIQCLECSLDLDPEAPDAHLNLATLMVRAGQLDVAIAHGRQAVYLDPEYPEAWMLLGNIYAKINQYTDAAGCFDKMVALSPDSNEARFSLANALRGSGRFAEAVMHLKLLLNQVPKHPEILAALADTLQRMRESEQAEKFYRQLISFAPRDIRGPNGLAESLLSQGRIREAEQACIAALHINGDNYQALANLGTLLQAKGNLESAQNYLQRAVSLVPDNAAVQYKYSSIQLALGRFENAKFHCLEAIRLNPGFMEGRAALAAIYEQEGDYESAWDILKSLVNEGNRSPHVLTAYASLAHRYDQIPQSIELLNELVSDVQLSRVTRAQVYHQLGDLYERAGDYDRAFACHQNSNRLKESNFDPKAHAEHIDRLITICDHELLNAGPRASNASILPVFIIGMPRSGTSLVEQILASHPLVHGAGELLDIIKISSSLCRSMHSELTYPDCLSEITQTQLDDIAGNYLKKLRGMNSSAIRVTDKMPHNFLHLGLIQILFPAARVVHIKRNKMDTCVSIYFQEFSNWHSYAYDLNHLAVYYREYERLMRHWKRVIDLPILEVEYEHLVADQEGESRRMIEFLGLEWDEHCLDFFENKRHVATPSYDQVRQPIYTHSVGRWHRYASHLEPLKVGLGMGD